MNTHTPHQPDQRLEDLLGALRHTKRVRRRRGVLALSGVVACLVLIPVLSLPAPAPKAPPSQAPAVAGGSTTPVPETSPRGDVPSVPGNSFAIDTAPVPTGRLITVSNRTTPSTIQRLSDDELLDTLRSTGRRAGIIRTGGSAFVDGDWLTQNTRDENDERSDAVPTPRAPTA